ncbi:hypothetical protein GCM10017600_26190 [Streptosporangium carneum]|uniref:Uncharacterized protein n=1 Tax=Streptosporangium carneum TaxID=47481 RepID=A0A9W6I017_9ACTN|nr:hypothetical protein GCM10017600_26190 [Streptosporangium carneum]
METRGLRGTVDLRTLSGAVTVRVSEQSRATARGLTGPGAEGAVGPVRAVRQEWRSKA